MISCTVKNRNLKLNWEFCRFNDEGTPSQAGSAFQTLVAHPCHKWLYYMSQVAQKDGRGGSIQWQYSIFSHFPYYLHL